MSCRGGRDPCRHFDHVRGDRHDDGRGLRSGLEAHLNPAVTIGGTVALCALFGGPLTGASMNPARSIGPALVQGEMQHMWLYVLAPIVGAALAVGLYRAIWAELTVPTSD